MCYDYGSDLSLKALQGGDHGMHEKIAHKKQCAICRSLHLTLTKLRMRVDCVIDAFSMLEVRVSGREQGIVQSDDIPDVSKSEMLRL